MWCFPRIQAFLSGLNWSFLSRNPAMFYVEFLFLSFLPTSQSTSDCMCRSLWRGAMGPFMPCPQTLSVLCRGYWSLRERLATSNARDKLLTSNEWRPGICRTFYHAQDSCCHNRGSSGPNVHGATLRNPT